MKTTAIVGAGVVGLLCAYEITRRGGSVILIDKGDPGDACSRGNTGWVVPSFSSPLPGPGMVGDTLRWMLRADSPVYIRPRSVPALAGWLWRFWRHCNPVDHAVGLAAVTELNRRTMPSFDALKSAGVRFEMHLSGLLCAFKSRAGYDRTLASLQAIDAVGALDIRELSASASRAQEPALADDVVGGIYVAGERHVRPESLNAGLVEWLARAGAEIRSNVEVTGMSRKGPGFELQTAGGAIPADALVLAAGAWSGGLARQLGLRLPVQAGKGYTITIESPAIELRAPVYLPEKKIVTSPFEGALRVGGTMELSKGFEAFDARRLVAIRRGAEGFLPGCFEGGRQTEWMGPRPLTPDGIPVIGPVPGFDNAYVATGHAMLGVTLGPATAVAVADLVLEGRTAVPIGAFDPGRFAA